MSVTVAPPCYQLTLAEPPLAASSLQVGQSLSASLHERLHQDLGEGEHHREQHPDVQHLDVGGRGQRLGDPDEAGQ